MSHPREGGSRPPPLLILTVPKRRATGRAQNPMLHDYIDGNDGPYHPRQFASPVRLPTHASDHHDPFYRGESPQSISTSTMVLESDRSYGSLPHLTSNLISLASGSSHSSMGIRQLARSARTLGMGPDEVLVADGRPPVQPVFQCPFRLLGCLLDYSDVEAWLWHSLEHFLTGPSRLAQGRATVMPPRSNRCCFCPKTFVLSSGFRSWRARMDHVALHHEIGASLAHARPDFQLFDYLWGSYLINEDTYRELKGSSLLRHGVPSPPSSDPSVSPPPTPTATEERVIAVVHERRHDRHRQR